MRKVLILSSLAAGALIVAGLAQASTVKVDRVQVFKEKLSDVAFCQKGYEIASSFPSYASHTAPNITERIELLNQSDQLQAKSDRLLRMMEGPLKEEARSLGIKSYDYKMLVQDISSKAEVEAVISYQQTEEPVEFLGQLDQVCSTYLT